MGGFVTNVIKKKVKQLHEGYVKLKEDKKSKKERRQEECDKSGLYRAEPTEDLYERLLLTPEDQLPSSTSSNNTKLSLPVSCPSKNSSKNVMDKSLESSRESFENTSPSTSLDSGISRTPPGFKKLKKLQFSSDSNEVHVFEPDTFERRSNKAPYSHDEPEKAELCKTKVYVFPSPEKVEISNQDIMNHSENDLSTENNPKADANANNQSPQIPFKYLRIKQSIVSPKTYNTIPKKKVKHPTTNSFLGNFAERNFPDNLAQKFPRVNLNKEDSSMQCPLTPFNNYNKSCDKELLIPLLKSPPEKPPRSAKDLQKTSFDFSSKAFQDKSVASQTQSTFLSENLKDSIIDEDVYSIPFDAKKKHLPEMSSTPIKEVPTDVNEHIYAQVTPRFSRDANKILTSTALEITKNKPEYIYSQVTPRSSRNIKQDVPSSDIKFPKSLTQVTRETIQNSEAFFPCSPIYPIPDIKSRTGNDVLSKECKDKLNLLHKTNLSGKMGDISNEPACQNKVKTPDEVCVEQKFVVNMFESRPSKRWEKHIRDLDIQKNDEKFDRNVWKRLSLDSKKEKTKNLEANVEIVNNDLEDIEDNIEKLEKETKGLEVISEKIRRELQRMEQEDNETYLKKLEKDKLRIENHLHKLNNNEDEVSVELTHKSKRIETEMEKIKSQSTEGYNKYKKLKKSRDIQCTRMTQASRALEEIQTRRGKKDWLEVLVAERTLLETSEQVKLLTQQIRDNTYTIIPEPPLHKGTILLSDIKFPFAKKFRGNTKQDKHYTEFFVMTLSYGTQIFVSEFITGECDPLMFSRNHTFRDVTPDFEIKVKLFCLRLRTSDEYFWEKFTCYNLCPTSQIIYEDLLTHQFQERTVYKTSFKLCAEATLTRTNINEVSTKLNTKPEVFCKLDTQIDFSLKCKDIDIVADLSGFLDVGTLYGEKYFWEKKWCVLDGPNLKMYNYPQEEDFGKPFEQINLEYCFGPIITKVDNCPKRRSFQLRTGRPNDIRYQNTEDRNVHTLKTKPNFTLRKLYFAADTMDDYLQWTVEVEKILNSLSDFKKLAFGEEYVEYLK